MTVPDILECCRWHLSTAELDVVAGSKKSDAALDYVCMACEFFDAVTNQSSLKDSCHELLRHTLKSGVSQKWVIEAKTLQAKMELVAQEQKSILGRRQT